MRCTEAEQNPEHRARKLQHPFTLAFCAFENCFSAAIYDHDGNSATGINCSRNNTSDSDQMRPS